MRSVLVCSVFLVACGDGPQLRWTYGPARCVDVTAPAIARLELKVDGQGVGPVAPCPAQFDFPPGPHDWQLDAFDELGTRLYSGAGSVAATAVTTFATLTPEPIGTGTFSMTWQNPDLFRCWWNEEDDVDLEVLVDGLPVGSTNLCRPPPLRVQSVRGVHEVRARLRDPRGVVLGTSPAQVFELLPAVTQPVTATLEVHAGRAVVDWALFDDGHPRSCAQFSVGTLFVTIDDWPALTAGCGEYFLTPPLLPGLHTIRVATADGTWDDEIVTITDGVADTPVNLTLSR